MSNKDKIMISPLIIMIKNKNNQLQDYTERMTESKANRLKNQNILLFAHI